MFAPLIHSFLITCMLVAVVWVSAAVLRRKSKPYPHLVPLGLLFTGLLFIPSCMGVGRLHDAVVYREFGYDAPPGSVWGYRIPMPDSATGIRVRTYVSGHDTAFKVTEAALDDWMRSLNLEAALPPGADDAATRSALVEYAATRFRHAGWTLPPDTYRRGFKVLGANGASISVWYSRSTQTACTLVNYR